MTFNTAAARREITALVSRANKSFGLLGGLALVGATAAVAGLVRATQEIGQAALQASIDYEQAFAGVRKTVDDGTLSAVEATQIFGKLNQELRDLALEIPVDLEDDIAKVAELGGQLGIPAEQLTEFTRIINEVGVTSNVAVEDAATSFARLANIMGLTEKDFRGLGDTLINLGNKLPAQEDEILRFANRIAAAGEIAGFTADEVLAVGAAFASVGVPSERGGTAVQRTWIKITQAVAEGGEILDLIAEVSGETSEQFRQHWETDAAGAWSNFVEGLGRAGTSAFGILRDLGLNDQRVIQSLLSLASAGTLMRDTFALAENDLGALATESDIFFNTTQGHLQDLQNTVHDAGITIGDQLSPAFNEGVEMAIEWFEANQDLIKSIGEDLAGALEAVVPLVDDILNNLGKLFGSIAEIAGSEFVSDAADTVEDLNQRGLAGVQIFADLYNYLSDIPIVGRLAAKSLPLLIPGGKAILGDVDITELTLIEERLRALRESGQAFDVVDTLADAFFELDGALEAVGRDLGVEEFAELIDEFDLTEAQALSLAEAIGRENLTGAMLELLGITQQLNDLQRRGRGGARPPTQRERVQQAVEEILSGEGADEILSPEAAAAEAAAANLKTMDDAFKALRETQEAYAASVDTVIDNWERLAPPDLQLAIEQFGEGEVKADFFARSLLNLRNVMDFRPAAEGIFGTGDIINGIELATRQIENADGKMVDVQVHARDVTRQIVENMNEIANFEAGLAILAQRGFETLAGVLRDQGPEMAHVVEDFVFGAPGADAGLAERALEAGGVIEPKMMEALEDAFGGQVPQEVLDLVASFGNHEVQSVAYRAGYDSGAQYGSGWLAGLIGSLPPAAAALLGLETVTPPGYTGGDVGRGGEANVPRTYPGYTGGDVGRGGDMHLNFYTVPSDNATTQRLAASIANVTGYHQ